MTGFTNLDFRKCSQFIFGRERRQDSALGFRLQLSCRQEFVMPPFLGLVFIVIPDCRQRSCLQATFSHNFGLHEPPLLLALSILRASRIFSRS